jgi:hypothetical protein
MKVIGVLRDEELEFAEPLELDEGQVGSIGRNLVWRDPPPRCWQSSIAPRPHPVGTTKVGNAGVGADACTRKGDKMLELHDPASNGLDVLSEVLFPRHDAASRSA